MQCMNCGGQLEWAGGGKYARCFRDLSLFSQENGQLTPVVVQAPGGGFNPEFNNIFAQNLGFGPPPPGAQPMPPPMNQGMNQGMQQPPQPQHNMAAGQFDLGGGQQLRVKINGQTPENFVKNKVSSMIWGWIIGLIILALIVLGGIGLGIYIYFQAKEPSPAVAAKQAQAAAWDGKTPFTCAGADVITLTGVTATAGVKATAACQLTLVNVNITAPVAIEATASSKVTMTGGSINATTNSVVASANAQVDLVGTKVTGAGKSKKSGSARINGAP